MNSDRTLDEMWLSDPALGSFLSTLTSGATDDELASQYSVLAAFRDARDAPVQPVRRARRRGRLAVAAAIAALVISVAAAGYARVLPPSLQHVADRVLRLAGLHYADQHVQRLVTGHAGAQPRLPQRAGAQSASPGPGSGQARPPVPLRTGLTALAAGPAIQAGADVVITAWLTENGRGVPGAVLHLHEHVAGKPGWHLVTMARTRAGGGVTLDAGHLTVNASFRVTGPGSHASTQFNVIVIPRVWLHTRAGTSGQPNDLAVRCRYAAPGDDVLLQVLSSPARWSGAAPRPRAWRTVRVGQIGKAGRASFVVSSDAAGQVYRVVLLATATHGRAASRMVLVEPEIVYLSS